MKGCISEQYFDFVMPSKLTVIAELTKLLETLYYIYVYNTYFYVFGPALDNGCIGKLGCILFT